MGCGLLCSSQTIHLDVSLPRCRRGRLYEPSTVHRCYVFEVAGGYDSGSGDGDSVSNVQANRSGDGGLQRGDASHQVVSGLPGEIRSASRKIQGVLRAVLEGAARYGIALHRACRTNRHESRSKRYSTKPALRSAFLTVPLGDGRHQVVAPNRLLGDPLEGAASETVVQDDAVRHVSTDHTTPGNGVETDVPKFLLNHEPPETCTTNSCRHRPHFFEPDGTMVAERIPGKIESVLPRFG